jgi:hypothetical protein
MNNKFEQAVVESLQAVESYHEAMADIDNMVKTLDEAVSAQTGGQVGIRAIDSFVKGVNRLVDQAEDEEDLPHGLIRIFAYVYNAPDRQREVCALHTTRAGYPIEVLSFANTRTSCLDVESLEYKLEDIIRDARSGLKLKALMSEAQTEVAEPPAIHEGVPEQADAE